MVGEGEREKEKNEIKSPRGRRMKAIVEAVEGEAGREILRTSGGGRWQM